MGEAGEKILVVEDEKPIAEILKFNLEREGYKVLLAFDGEEAVARALGERPDLVILDIMLPKKDGFTVCRQVRAGSRIPIMMLTAKQEEVDKVLGLELGADDYITKPFSVREVIARVKAVLRRTGGPLSLDGESGEGLDGQPLPKPFKVGELLIDPSSYEIQKGDAKISVTRREFEIVMFLATRPGHVFSREVLLDRIWGYKYFGDTRTVDVAIRRLREKIEDDPSLPKFIKTKRGVGYYWEKSS